MRRNSFSQKNLIPFFKFCEIVPIEPRRCLGNLKKKITDWNLSVLCSYMLLLYLKNWIWGNLIIAIRNMKLKECTVKYVLKQKIGYRSMTVRMLMIRYHDISKWAQCSPVDKRTTMTFKWFGFFGTEKKFEKTT